MSLSYIWSEIGFKNYFSLHFERTVEVSNTENIFHYKIFNPKKPGPLPEINPNQWPDLEPHAEPTLNITLDLDLNPDVTITLRLKFF